MALKPDENPINVAVDLASSDGDEDEGRRRTRSINDITSAPEPPVQTNRSSEFRSFWKAGGYEVGVNRSIHKQGGELEHARVHPKFLHSNATSHKWAFGAIAELLDNVVDEISSGATFVKLDKIYNVRDHTPALLFQDNGGGMDPGSMRQCMSLGYSNKKENTIGQYGNGFKTSTMRLGADVIVFSSKIGGSQATQSIGLLSYTYLRTTGQDDVIVPMIDFEVSGDRKQPIVYSSKEDWSHNLRTILEWSPYASEQELMLQFEDIGAHGTKIIIYNLWQNDDGLLEFDFDSNEEDIRLRDEVNHDKSLRKSERLIESHISYHLRFSLRAYASILYLRDFKNFEIILRGNPVRQYNIVGDLKFLEVVNYRPQLGKASKEVSVKAEIGFVKEAPLLRVSGFNVYHKNRLIRPFWKVTTDGTGKGNGVVGIIEANFVEPAHDKQDFERSTLYLRLETRLKQMTFDFWKRHCHLIGNNSQIAVVRNLRKECPAPAQPSNDNTANIQEFAPDQPDIRFSDNTRPGSNLGHPVIGLAANQEPISNGQSGMQLNFSNVQPIIGLAASSPKDASVNGSGSAIVDQICEENIQLFMRCEEHRQKETALKQTIQELEKELMERRLKCSQLASHLDSQRKQMSSRRLTRKA